MRLIASTPDQKKTAYKFYLIIITVICILAIPNWILYLKADSANRDLVKYLEVAASDFLEKDKEISEFKIDSLEFSHKTEESEEVYLFMYSMKPVDPENFVLKESGIKGEDGWIHEVGKYVTVKHNNKLIFSSKPNE